MKNKTELKPIVAALGAVLATSAFGVSAGSTDQNPFQMTELPSGYMVAGKEGSCGEGKCGEGNCGAKKAVKMMDKNGDGSISWMEWDQGFAGMDKNQDGKLTASEMEGKCGEGNCGENKSKEGSCGESKSEEGKCGEGKCGS